MKKAERGGAEISLNDLGNIGKDQGKVVTEGDQKNRADQFNGNGKENGCPRGELGCVRILVPEIVPNEDAGCH